uniref:hypothetical protein n=1 Tax=Streptomyces chartreusis TaxID=1969 RepID=UPI003F4905F4
MPAATIWVELHQPWNASEVAILASGLEISISPTRNFMARDHAVPRSVKLCLGNAGDVGTPTTTLRTLADGLERGRPTWASSRRV